MAHHLQTRNPYQTYAREQGNIGEEHIDLAKALSLQIDQAFTEQVARALKREDLEPFMSLIEEMRKAVEPLKAGGRTIEPDKDPWGDIEVIVTIYKKIWPYVEVCIVSSRLVSRGFGSRRPTRRQTWIIDSARERRRSRVVVDAGKQIGQ